MSFVDLRLKISLLVAHMFIVDSAPTYYVTGVRRLEHLESSAVSGIVYRAYDRCLSVVVGTLSHGLARHAPPSANT